MRLQKWLLAAALIGVYKPMMAEELTPTRIVYKFSKNSESKSDECGIQLVISSFPSPEIASARLSLIHEKHGETNVFGISIKDVDVVFKNSKAESYNTVRLSHAELSSDEFSSDGRLNGGPMQDGSIWIYASDQTTALALSVGPRSS